MKWVLFVKKKARIPVHNQLQLELWADGNRWTQQRSVHDIQKSILFEDSSTVYFRRIWLVIYFSVNNIVGSIKLTNYPIILQWQVWSIAKESFYMDLLELARPWLQDNWGRCWMQDLRRLSADLRSWTSTSENRKQTSGSCSQMPKRKRKEFVSILLIILVNRSF